MPDVKPSGMPADTGLDDNHYVILNDPVGPTTKTTTLGVLRAWLRTVSAWVIGGMIDFTTMPAAKAQYLLAGSGGTASTSYVNLPGGSNSISFTKRRGVETKLVITGSFGYYMTASSNGMFLGVNVNSTDYDLARINNNQAGTGSTITGSNEITGLAAGPYTITLRTKVVASTINQDNLFSSSISVIEVPA